MKDLAYIAELNRRPAVNTRVDLLSGLFPEQRALIIDPSRAKAGVCPRRSGKTWGVTRYAAHVANSKPRGRVGYLTKTRDWAEELVWQPLTNLNKSQDLGGVFHSTKLKATFPNGSVIRLAGAKDSSQVEVLRGFAYDLLIIDEAASIDPGVMRYVVREVLPAALGERKGTLLVIGTPNRSCSGWFFDITNPTPEKPSNFSHHTWGLRHNLYHERWKDAASPEERQQLIEQFLAEERRAYGLKPTDPEYLREYEALWARDETLFIFCIGDECIELPPDPQSSGIKLSYILTIDLGWSDHTAFELVGYSQQLRKMWEIDSYNAQHMTMDDIGAKTVDYMENYRLGSIKVDAAGAGKIIQETIAREYARRYGVPCEPAQKTEKGAIMKYAASDCRVGRCFFLPNSVARDQLNKMEWDDRHLREKDPPEGEHNDNADAWIYAYRSCYHWLHEPQEYIPEVGTAERANWEMDQLEQEQADQLVSEEQREWWEDI